MAAPRLYNQSSFTDSPWFWVCLFSAAGVVALVLGSARITSRQTQIEREYLARQLSGSVVLNETPPQTSSHELRNRITLSPLLIALGGIVVIAWSLLWWQQRSTGVPATDSPEPTSGKRNHLKGLRQTGE